MSQRKSFLKRNHQYLRLERTCPPFETDLDHDSLPLYNHLVAIPLALVPRADLPTQENVVGEVVTIKPHLLDVSIVKKMEFLNTFVLRLVSKLRGQTTSCIIKLIVLVTIRSGLLSHQLSALHPFRRFLLKCHLPPLPLKY
jgi:hypothetical protein